MVKCRYVEVASMNRSVSTTQFPDEATSVVPTQHIEPAMCVRAGV